MKHNLMTTQGFISKIAHRSGHLSYRIFLVLFASLMIAASAQIQIPLLPVPVTLQTFAVLFVSMTLGWRLGFFAIAAYLVEGAIGLPVFTGFSGGFMHLIGPTGGYLAGFLIFGTLAGVLVQYKFAKNYLAVFLVALLCLSGILCLGTLFLASFVGLHKAYLLGAEPFYLGEACKAVMLMIMIPSFWKKGA